MIMHDYAVYTWFLVVRSIILSIIRNSMLFSYYIYKWNTLEIWLILISYILIIMYINA